MADVLGVAVAVLNFTLSLTDRFALRFAQFSFSPLRHLACGL